MNDLSAMLWVEFRKAVRSRMPLYTALGSLFFPLGIAFLIFVARNPEISRQLGLISAKANLMAYSATDWQTYLRLFAMIIAAGGYFLFVLVISWVFGREFTDGTLKDMLAVPVRRSSILLAKFIIVVAWSVMLILVILIGGLLMGAVIKLPAYSIGILFQGIALVGLSACLAVAVVLPFAFFASVGRGYLLPLGLAILALMMANIVGLAGWGEYFPWAVPGLFAQSQTPLSPLSFWIVILTGLVGMLATYWWWMTADQNR